ncbi:hypothetical protein LPN04_29985 [Rugamonas sp. A1-17]|nr:hypothetical protein [Rugamonas sp. A1-17]
MHPSITMRSTDASFPDLPPASFDYDATTFETPIHDEPAPRGVVNHTTMLPEGPATRQAMKIARAIAGTSEIRLLREKVTGMVDTFILETAVMQPYHAVRAPLTQDDGETRTPLTEEDALNAFNEAVLAKYPAEKLFNGRQIPIHMNLM